MIKSILIIIRPVNVLITALSVYLGGLVSFNQYYDRYLLVAAISAGLIAGFGNITNDIFDINIDRRAKPFRPLPAGTLSIRSAVLLAMTLVATGIILSGIIGDLCLLIASVTAISLLAYTPAFKGKAYRGNVLVAFISALAFFYGAAAVGNVDGGLIPAVFAFLFHLIREIIKDMEDWEADKAEGVMTGAVRNGVDFSRNLVIVFAAILIITTLIPYIIGIYHTWYLITVIAGCDVFLLLIIITLSISSSPRVCRFIAAFMKALMPLGLLAVFLGSRGL
jgi:geranylgeranylglycerol-phosphate geranylgeranyltransferase